MHAQNILVGPLLGIEGNDLYTVCFLSVKDTKVPELNFETSVQKFTKITETPNGTFWRTEMRITIGTKGRTVKYVITLNGKKQSDKFNRDEWEFYVPGKDETPRIAYASCNGFSEPKLYKKTNEPYRLWDDMTKEHRKQQFSILIMGGDQIYADNIWEEVAYLKSWRTMKYQSRITQKPPATFTSDLENFYEKIYKRYWSHENMSRMMASIPSIMMWDDHDIFDGWGSYPDTLQLSQVFQGIFSVAKRYFELFQIRSQFNKALTGYNNKHFNLGLKFRDYLILGLDTRSHRTRKKVMAELQWTDMKNWIKNQPENSLNGKETLIVLASVPVVYMRFGAIESAMLATPWLEEPEDDLLDQWSSSLHEGEQIRLIHNLNEYSKYLDAAQTVIISGDVHVGGVGEIVNQKTGWKIHQVISSAIAHPPPTKIEWFGLNALSSDRPITFDDYKLETLKPHQTSKKYILDRNYAVLKREDDGKIWVNWKCDTWKEQPLWVIS